MSSAKLSQSPSKTLSDSTSSFTDDTRDFSASQDQSQKVAEHKKLRLLGFLLVMSLCMVASMSGQYMNVCQFLFQAKYSWQEQSTIDINLALMNTIPSVGTILGSIFGSLLIQRGRARAFVIAMLIGMGGSLLTLVANWPVFLVAKLVVGVSMGITGVLVARYIEEWVPLEWFGISQAISLTCLQLGVLLSTIMGLILPEQDDLEALENNKNWRLIFGLQPAMYGLVLLLFSFLVKRDPPKFYLLTGKEEKARTTIDSVYQTGGDSSKIDAVQDFLLQSSGETRVEVSFKEALVSDEQYVRASWVAIFIMMAQVCTGYYALIAYSCDIFIEEFADEKSGEKFRLTPEEGAYLVATANLFGSVASIFLIHKAGRRTILLFGQGTITLCLGAMAFASFSEKPLVLLILTCCVSFIFQMTIGPLAPLYAAEVCCDVALGAVMVTEDVFTLIQVFATPTLLNSGLSHTGTFSLFATLSLLGLCFLCTNVPETKGLIERQKKELFVPGAKYGRKLRSDEISIKSKLESKKQAPENTSQKLVLSDNWQIQTTSQPSSRTSSRSQSINLDLSVHFASDFSV